MDDSLHVQGKKKVHYHDELTVPQLLGFSSDGSSGGYITSEDDSRSTHTERTPLTHAQRRRLIPRISVNEGLVFASSKAHAGCESLDYDPVINVPFDIREEERLNDGLQRRLARLSLELGVAMCTGLLGAAFTYTSGKMTTFKYGLGDKYLADHHASGDYNIWKAFGVVAATNIVFSLISALCVTLVDPYVRGSGVPEIKGYLNGVRLPGVFGFRAFLSKVAGLLFAVPAGLVVGKEGPLIHIGAIVGYAFCHGVGRSAPKPYLELRNDQATRDFVGLGGGCGVAAAFGAPIGGVLALEEYHSLWGAILNWRPLMATMMTTITLFFILSCINHDVGVLSQESLITFGAFEGPARKEDYPIQPSYDIGELGMFAMMGVGGGLLGALFVYFNLIFARARSKYMRSVLARIGEVVLVALLTTVIVFGLSVSGKCVDDIVCDDDSMGQGQGEDYDPEENGVLCCFQPSLPMRQFNCPAGQHNALATLLYSTPPSAVQYLLHSCYNFHYYTLVIYCAAMFFLGFITYGISIPSGVFVPCMTIGAALGRIVGHVYSVNIHSNLIDPADPGTFGLIGAAAMLGGVSRQSISNTVIILEVTNDLSYAIPVMMATLVARFIGGVFTKSLYQSYVDMLGIAFISSADLKPLRSLLASEIMTPHPVCVAEVESVQSLLRTLSTTSSHGFPVVRKPDNVFQGLVTRAQLLVLLKYRCFQESALISSEDSSSTSSDSVNSTDLERYSSGSVLSWKTFRQYYSNPPLLEDIKLKPSDLEKQLDLRPYMNSSALVVHHSTHARRVHRLFRAMGLRHLSVIDSNYAVVGIITRSNLTSKHVDSLKKAGYAPEETLGFSEEPDEAEK